jgi:hypothetical protein
MTGSDSMSNASVEVTRSGGRTNTGYVSNGTGARRATRSDSRVVAMLLVATTSVCVFDLVRLTLLLAG